MFAENGFVVWTSDGPDAWIIDPGLPPQPHELLRVVEHHNLAPAAILLTHCHADHVAGIPMIRAAHPNVPILVPRDEARLLTDADANLSGGLGFPITVPPADRLLAAGGELMLGGLRWDVLDVAGHSPGGLAYYNAAGGVVIVGDALFAGSIGRVDFPGSSGRRLIGNIRAQLLTLPDNTVVYSGHGPATTIGVERRENPYLQGDPDLLVELEG
jgi:glyoxylase-like metal-dependent hydrolase (beta-lactamase superfamily II)